MALKDKEDRKAYMKEYMRKRYAQRKSKALSFLGGQCVQCASVEDLEFDHIDPDTKSFTVTTRLDSSSWEDIEVELLKCQLLCKSCHDMKTTGGVGAKMARLKCPYCEAVFVRPYRNTFMVSGALNSYCSRSCLGKAVTSGQAGEDYPGNLIEVFYKK